MSLMQSSAVVCSDGIFPIAGDFHGKDILSLDQFSREDLAQVIALTREMKGRAQRRELHNCLANLLVTLLFFEPSSRTIGSFDAATKRLGGQTIVVADPVKAGSTAKGESFSDTIRTFATYTDAIVIRHPLHGAASLAAEATGIPIINAGDGINEHPTQGLLDLYTIFERFGKLDGLTGLLVGDVQNSRCIHSLLRGMALGEGNTVYLLSPPQLRLPSIEAELLRSRGLKLIEIERAADIPRTCQFWYWTRIQRERFASQEHYHSALEQSFTLTPTLLEHYASEDMIIMDPLPRVAESVVEEVDSDQRAVYMQSQIQNGQYVRMALLALVLGRV